MTSLVEASINRCSTNVSIVTSEKYKEEAFGKAVKCVIPTWQWSLRDHLSSYSIHTYSVASSENNNNIH